MLYKKNGWRRTVKIKLRKKNRSRGMVKILTSCKLPILVQQWSAKTDYFVSSSKEDIIIAVMGVTGAGKSTFVSLLSADDIEIGHGLQSCKTFQTKDEPNQEPYWVIGTTKVGVYYFMLDGVRVWLIDTPGFDDTNRSDAEVLKDVAYWLAHAYAREIRLAGIIYLHRITDIRMQGSALRNLRMFTQLCGSNNLKSVILATTHWTDKEGKSVPESVGQARVKELEETEEFWGGMIARGSRVEKHDGSKTSATKIVSGLVNRQTRVTLDIQRQLVDEHRNLYDTDAGQALQRELIEERKRSEARLAELKLDMDFALQEKDKKWQEQIQRDRADFEAKIHKGYTETEELKTDIKKIEKERDAQIQKLQRKWDEDRASLETQLEKAKREIREFRAAQRQQTASPVQREQMYYGIVPMSQRQVSVQQEAPQYSTASRSQRGYEDLRESGIMIPGSGRRSRENELELQARLQRERELQIRLVELEEEKKALERRILRDQDVLRAAEEQNQRFLELTQERQYLGAREREARRLELTQERQYLGAGAREREARRLTAAQQTGCYDCQDLAVIRLAPRAGLPSQ